MPSERDALVVTRPWWFIAQQMMMTSLFGTVPVVLALAATPAEMKLPAAVTVASVVLFVLIRCARTAMLLDPRGIEVRDIWRTTRHSWADVEVIEVEAARPFPLVQIHPFTTIVLVLRNGHRRACNASCLLPRKDRDRLAVALARFAGQAGVRVPHIGDRLTTALEDARKVPGAL